MAANDSERASFAFTRQRSLVRNQHRPLVKYHRSLKPNRTITFQSGSEAKGRNELTNAYIYNSDVVDTKEGARVRTSVGTFIDKC